MSSSASPSAYAARVAFSVLVNAVEPRAGLTTVAQATSPAAQANVSRSSVRDRSASTALARVIASRPAASRGNIAR